MTQPQTLPGAMPPPPPASVSEVLQGLDPMGTPATPVWRLRWFQVLLGVLVSLAVASYVLPTVFSTIYMTRPVLLPVLVGLGLAYALNPLVTWAARRHRMPRAFSAAVLLIWFYGLLGLGFAWLTGPVIGQAESLVRDLPGYVEATTRAATRWWDLSVDSQAALHRTAEGDFENAAAILLPLPEDAEAAPAATQQNADVDPSPAERIRGPEADRQDAVPGDFQVEDLAEPAEREEASGRPGLVTRLMARLRGLELSTLSSTGLAVLDVGASTIVSAVGLLGYLLVATLVTSFCFYYATWRWPAFVAWWLPYLPASSKARVCEVAARMDLAVAAFLRGRLVQASILSVVLAVGFTWVGTPVPLILGIAGGILGLIPYAGAIVWPIAVLLAVMSRLALPEGPSLWWAVMGPTLVYGFGQALDSWAIEPLVQGKATNLDALTVLLVVLAGGAVAGLLGLLLAIPFAACVKILWHEVVGPRLRTIARAS